jgi:hypothetical protein
MTMTFQGTQGEMDRESDPTIEITVLNGFRFIECDTFLDVVAEEAQDRAERERAPVSARPIRPVSNAVERHGPSSHRSARAPGEKDAATYREACRRVLAPFPAVPASSAMHRIREKLRALALAAWRGPGVALLRKTSSAVFAVLRWLGAARRQFASSFLSSLAGFPARLTRIARQATRLMFRRPPSPTALTRSE